MINTKLRKLVDPNNECCCEYELAYMCKERAFTKGYVYVENNLGYSKINKIGTEHRKFWEDEEYNPFRIFKACEFILKETNKCQ